MSSPSRAPNTSSEISRWKLIARGVVAPKSFLPHQVEIRASLEVKSCLRRTSGRVDIDFAVRAHARCIAGEPVRRGALRAGYLFNTAFI